MYEHALTHHSHATDRTKKKTFKSNNVFFFYLNNKFN